MLAVAFFSSRFRLCMYVLSVQSNGVSNNEVTQSGLEKWRHSSMFRKRITKPTYLPYPCHFCPRFIFFIAAPYAQRSLLGIYVKIKVIWCKSQSNSIQFRKTQSIQSKSVKVSQSQSKLLPILFLPNGNQAPAWILHDSFMTPSWLLLTPFDSFWLLLTPSWLLLTLTDFYWLFHFF